MKVDNNRIKSVVALFDKEDIKYIKSKYYIEYLQNQKEQNKVKKLVIKK